MKENVKQVLCGKHVLSDEFVRKIDAEDKKELFRLLSKSRADDPSTSLIVDALARVSPAELIPHLVKMLDKPDRERDVLTAITTIGQIGGTDEEKHLLKLLKKQVSPLIIAKTALALGKIGTKASLKPLVLLIENREIETAPIRLGIFLLASRIQSKWSELTKIDFAGKPKYILLASENVSIIKIKKAQIETSKAALNKLTDSFGMSFSEKEAMEYICLKDNYMLVYNSNSTQLSGNEKSESIACPLSVLLKSPVDESWSARYFAFLLPEDSEGKKIYVLRTDGYRLLQGTLKDSRFTLQSVSDKPVAALTVKGKLNDNRLIVDQLEIISEILVRNKMTPAPMSFK